MPSLLFPGRHHLLTTFQLEYLTLVTCSPAETLCDVNGRPLALRGRIDRVIWAVTSANHANTRRNPLPGHRREAAIEEFAGQLEAESLVYLIDDVGRTPDFAAYVLKKIAVDSLGQSALTPQNAVVGCSTPDLIEQYEALGFQVLPVELADRHRPTFAADPPWRVLDTLIAAGLGGADWRTHPAFLTKVARASRRLYLKYGLGDRIVDLHRHPVLTEDGDVTATRDYNTYVRSFDEGAGRKYARVRDWVRPGRICDIGCCTGALLREMTRDERLRESDFYGVEIARRLYAECLHRKEQGHFADENVFFYQKDVVAGPIFAPNSVNTFTTFALTHEVESYLGRAALRRFIELLYQQTAAGGCWLNVDVVGPAHGDAEVWLWLNAEDGRNDDWERAFEPAEREAFRAYLNGTSTLARFQRFARDFRAAEGYRLAHELRVRDGRTYARLPLRDACEFLSKKDYTDNWQSEMHETFCFWDFQQWRSAVEAAGFRVHPASTAYANPWLVEHRYRGRAELFAERGGALVPREHDVTNMLLIAEKVA